MQCANRLFWPLLSKYTILVPYLFFRVFCRIQIKYRIIIIKLCMRKCEIVKKIKIHVYVMIFKNYCVYVILKKNVMLTGLFTGHFANGRYAISIIATY